MLLHLQVTVFLCYLQQKQLMEELKLKEIYKEISSNIRK